MALALTFFTAASGAQPTPLPGDRAVTDLELDREYVLELDGEELVHAEIYYSRREAVYLVAAPELGRPLLVSPRGKSVQAVSPQKLSKSQGAGAELPDDASPEYLGRYEKSHGVITFELEGRTVRLLPRPPLLGRHTFGAVEDRHPRYAEKARAAVPEEARSKQAALKSMRLGGDVRVLVYFASWSPICERLVPKIMRLERELKGKLVFDYYGLPKPLSSDPVVRQEGIHAVPTAVVYVDGEEVGRLAGRALDTPGEALNRLLEAHR